MGILNQFTKIKWVFISLLLIISACSKDDEEETTINIPQTYTDIIQLSSGDWQADGNRIYSVKSISNITAEIANYGSVNVYFKSAISNEWQPLPYVFPNDNIIETYWYQAGSIEIERIASDSLVPATPTETLTYKVVSSESNNY